MKNNQAASTMPVHKYRPYQDTFRVDLPDRTWPSNRITEAHAGAPSTCATATRLSSTR